MPETSRRTQCPAGIPATGVSIPAMLARMIPTDFISQFPPTHRAKGIAMKNPLDSLWGTLISGLILTAVLAIAVWFCLS